MKKFKHKGRQVCYTLKCLEDSKNGEGFFYQCRRLHDNICRKYDTKLINETVCNNPDVKSHSIV